MERAETSPYNCGAGESEKPGQTRRTALFIRYSAAGGIEELSTFGHRLLLALFLAAKSALKPVALGANALVLDEAGRVLLVRHGYMAGWQLPGGGVAPGETPGFAMRRELEEEIGLTGGMLTLVGHYARKILWMGHVVVLYRIEGAVIAFRPSMEVREILWADAAAPPPNTTPASRRRLAELAGAPGSDIW